MNNTLESISGRVHFEYSCSGWRPSSVLDFFLRKCSNFKEKKLKIKESNDYKSLFWYFCNITESRWFWKQLSRSPLQNSGQLFPIKWLSISFPIDGSIKLMIINMTYPCIIHKDNYLKQLIKILSSCLGEL